VRVRRGFEEIRRLWIERGRPTREPVGQALLKAVAFLECVWVCLVTAVVGDSLRIFSL
jgi:hypothetical protein